MPAIQVKRGNGGGGTGSRALVVSESPKTEVYVIEVTSEYVTVYTENEAADRLAENQVK